ncbi:MAG: efflux RND transporter periplasmic adaptor subunit [Alphaproteobacteria bacterium]
MRRLVVATLAVAALLALALGWWGTATDAPEEEGGDAEVAVRTAEVREPEQTGPTVTATVEEGLIVPVTAPRQAAVGEVAVAEGDQVERGDVLVRFEQTTEQASVMSAEAELDQAREELRAARDRAESEAFADSDLVAEDRMSELEAAVEQARDGLEAARAGLAEQNVEAPVAGRVESVAVARGELVTADGLLLELRREDAPGLRFGVPPEARAELAVDDEVEIVTDGDEGTAKVVATRRPPDDVTAGLEVVAEPDDAEALPSPGSTVEVSLPAGEVSWVTVPRAALLDDEGGQRVFRVERGVAWSLPVEMAPEAEADAEDAESDTEEWVAVRGALQPGERVATTELDNLTDGAPVEVIDEAR